MRESIGMTWVFQIMLVFILLFAGFLAIYINFSKTYKIKNEVLNFIEKKEGMTDGIASNPGSIKLITNYLKTHNYGTTGVCPNDAGWYGAKALNGNLSDLTEAIKGEKYYYCVRKVDSNDNKNPNKVFYEVRVFFKFDLPVFGNLHTFSIEGETVDIDFPADNLVVAPAD